MAPDCCMLCESWKGTGHVYGEKAVGTGQGVTLAALFGRPGNLRRFGSTSRQAAASCTRCARWIAHATSPAVRNKADKQERQHLLWRTGYNQGHTRWRDNRHRSKQDPYSPNSVEYVEALWLNKCYYKTALVDVPLADVDARTEHRSTPAACLLLDRGEQLTTLEFVKQLCQQGQVKGAVEVLEVSAGTSCCGIDKYVLYSVLKECVAKKDLMLGGRVHALAMKVGFGADTFLCSHFIRMYAGHGKLREAMDVFQGLALPDAFAWSAIISAHTKQGQAERAIELYKHMRATRTKPDGYVLAAALQACATAGDLQSGKQMHDDAFTCGMEHGAFISSCLLEMYVKCGSLKDARRLFDRLEKKDVVTWTVMIAGYAKVEGMGEEALSLYSAMHSQGTAVPDRVTFVCLLQACANVGVSALCKGKQLHSQIKERGLQCDAVVGGCLVNMYAKCGSLVDARTVFDGLRARNVVTWTAMIAGYAKEEGMGQEALDLYSALLKEGHHAAVPDAVTFVCLLQACANVGAPALERGKQLHSQIKKLRAGGGLLESDVMAVGGSLVNMYAKCGSLTDARSVFDGLREKNVVTWSAMIAGYAKVEGMGQEALSLYSAMHKQGGTVVPDRVTFGCLLQACANVGALDKGKQLHSQIKEQRLECDSDVGGCLVNMYAKCGNLADARTVFDGLREKTVVTWSAMIAGYAKVEGMGHEALGLYDAMRKKEGTGAAVAPDRVTVVRLLQACANVGVSALEMGKQLHAELKGRGLVECDAVVGGRLVNMYAKCGSLVDARIVFDGLGSGEKDVVTWTAMIAGYAQQEGMGQEALNLYNAMHREGTAIPNAVTFMCVLQACANVGLSALEMGKQLHSQIKDLRGGLQECDVGLGGSLVNMYAKCGSLADARSVFDSLPEKNVVTWSAMIAGYAKVEGMGQEALNLYSAMLRSADGDQGRPSSVVVPDRVTFGCLLQACANVGVSALDMGKQLHTQIKELLPQAGLDDADLGGSLVNMYAKCGSLADARIVFDGLCEKNVVTWNAMICGYAQQEGMGQDALSLYSAMMMHNNSDEEQRRSRAVTPDAVTYVCLLQACASVGAVHQGEQLHSAIRDAGLETNLSIATCLVKMYAQCGRLDAARRAVDTVLPTTNPELWTALLKGYAEHGDGEQAIQCFEELVAQGAQPDEVTYICLLTACSHAGLVDAGQRYFSSMQERHGVTPGAWHYTCMVDLLGRSGQLARAEHMLLASGLVAADDDCSAVSWTALLSACKTYGDAHRARRCFDRLVALRPASAAPYALLAGTHACAGDWDAAAEVEAARRAARARKKPARACIEVARGQWRAFIVGEESAPDVEAAVRRVSDDVKAGGHVPQTQLVVRAGVMSEREREDALCGHAEKLALAYGLLNTPTGSTLVVTKNLRMCGDCHSSTKVMSRVERREIVVRDGFKVHRFRDGACSCHDRP